MGTGCMAHTPEVADMQADMHAAQQQVMSSLWQTCALGVCHVTICNHRTACSTPVDTHALTLLAAQTAAFAASHMRGFST